MSDSGVFIRNPYNYPSDFVSRQTSVDFAGVELMTKQAPKDDCDINVIVARFGLTGRMPVSPRVPTYGDFTGIGSYQDALHAVREADAAFLELPSKVRERFRNSPQQLLMFVEDPRNELEARELGLLRPQPSTPAPVPPKAPGGV